jgi:hypothetical protein
MPGDVLALTGIEAAVRAEARGKTLVEPAGALDARKTPALLPVRKLPACCRSVLSR